MTDHEVGTIWRVGYNDNEFSSSDNIDTVLYQYFTTDYDIAKELYKHYIIYYYEDDAKAEMDDDQLEEFYNNPEPFYKSLDWRCIDVFLEQFNPGNPVYKPKIFNSTPRSERVSQYFNLTKSACKYSH